jgi:CRP-like cAMP-binding protein
LYDLRDGDFAAEFAGDSGPRLSGVRAVTDVVVARMPATAFNDVLDRFATVRERAFRVLAGRVRDLTALTDILANFGMRGRLSAQLLKLARIGSGEHLVVSPPPSHAELAARIGTRRETVCRHLGALCDEGVVSRSRSALTIIAPTKLRQIMTADERSF